MSDALIGHTGFVGGNLLRQRPFDATFNSQNIAEIEGKSFDLLVCSGAPAQKWKANKEPEPDLANLQALMSRLAKVQARRFVLISTIDVYPTPIDVDESTPIDESVAQPYGRHRRMLERFCEERFGAHVVRLPGLFGKGLKKNVIYDLLHDNLVDQIHPEGSFQYYDLEGIWRDVKRALDADLKLLNVSSEPIVTKDIARECFNRELAPKPTPGARYDMRSRHAPLFGGRDGYLFDRATTLEQLRAFVRSERA